MSFAGRQDSLATAAALSMVAGTLDGFTFVGHGHVFASAMTGNVVLLGVAVAQWSAQSINYLVPIIAFLFGAMAATMMQKPFFKPFVFKSPQVTAMVIELVILSVICLLPEDFDSRLLVTMLTIGTAMQNTTFRNIGKRSYNSIIMTGNLQNFASNFAAGILPADANALVAARDLGVVCAVFLIGAGVGAFLTPRLGNLTVLVPAVLLLIGLGLMMRAEAREAALPKPAA